jgi:glycosyltransferase involved in cell wall biosynthesis/SAM-dependent methyltransferase
MRVAFFSPLPPERSGIADYSEALLEPLRHLAKVEVFSRAAQPFDPARFDIALYQMGNNGCHGFVYDGALRHPGVVTMHESNLHHLMTEITIRRDDWDAYVRECEYAGGAAARAFAERVRQLEIGPDYEGLPMTRRLLEHARGVIVHSHFMESEIRAAGFAGPLKVIPHGAWIPPGARNRFRERLGLDETVPLVGIFGYLKPYKRIAESLRAFRRLLRLVPEAKMILVGEPHPDLPLAAMIRSLGLSAAVRILGFAPIDEFTGYLSACDIVLNLRYPTVGESSGTLLRAMGLGKAALVSEVGSFSEFPEDVCLKVPVGAGEEDTIFEYLNLLISRPDVAHALGERARDYVAEHCNWRTVAEQYTEFLEAVVEGHAGPGRGEPAAAALIEEVTELAAELAVAEEISAAEQAGGLPLIEAAPTGASVIEEMTEAAEAIAVAEEIPAAEQDDSSGQAGGMPHVDEATAPVEHVPDAEEMMVYLRGWAESAEAAEYLEAHQTRLERTLEMVPRGGPGDRILEMGAYLQMTPALRDKLGYGEVRGCYYGEAGHVDHRSVTSSSGETFTCDVDHFDAEKDRFPYPDEHFSTVLCCELIEHLFADPMHMMGEVNRILKPGGHLVLTTPNLASLRAIGAILMGYHPGFFHSYLRPADAEEGDARHNREYTPREIHNLLDNSGFAVTRLETGEFRDLPHPESRWVLHLLERYKLDTKLRGDGIYAVGRKTGAVRERYPNWLYT